VGIYLRLGLISQEDAEQQLANEVARIDAELRYNTNHRHRFVDCAERYLAESKHRRSVDVAAWHDGCSLPIRRRAPSHHETT
jgi:hypothetical protein